MNITKLLRIITRLLIGVLFIFSGYVKVIDPMGSAIKFGEYFEAFSMHFFAPMSLIFGILLAVAELVLGLCMFFGIRMKETAWGSLLFMIFFTGLTFVLAVFNPVEDCGCFGDAVKLTNWQTFFKNLIILPFVIFIFIQRKKYISIYTQPSHEWILVAVLAIFSVYLSTYTYRHLPLIDFMAYKVGVNIPEAMVMPDDAPQPVYDNTFIYEKDGVKKEFKLDDLPDSTWAFVDAKTKLISEGYVPPARDFTITNNNGDYITDSVLNLSGYMIFLISPEINKVNLKNVDKINKLYDYAVQEHYHFIMLSGSSDELNANYINKTTARYPIYHTDETVIKSMVRSNPGMMLLKDATIIKKWSYLDIPTEKEIDKIIKMDEAEYLINRHKSCERTTTAYLGLTVLLVFGGIIGFSRFKQAKTKKLNTKF